MTDRAPLPSAREILPPSSWRGNQVHHRLPSGTRIGPLAEGTPKTPEPRIWSLGPFSTEADAQRALSLLQQTEGLATALKVARYA